MRYLTHFWRLGGSFAGMAGATMLARTRRKHGFQRQPAPRYAVMRRISAPEGKPASRRSNQSGRCRSGLPIEKPLTVVAAAGARAKEVDDRAGERKVCGRGNKSKGRASGKRAARLGRGRGWILGKRYDPNSDPKLGELFHRVVDTVYGFTNAGIRGRWLSRGPACRLNDESGGHDVPGTRT